MKTKILSVLIGLTLSVAATLAQQVKVQINSGNPVYPFPQFQSYKNPSGILENLATRPGAGVSHAEMEQAIRDAYQIMMNRAEKPGGGVGGIDYIYFKSNPSCSEGDGYALLGAAAMVDKVTFDGLWLWIHDYRMNNVKRYSDCEESSPGYQYSRLPGWTGAAANSAADGDFDIGLALLCAYYQWGEFMGIKDACGEEISYKKEAIEFLKALTDTIIYASNGLNLVCGDIGLDGYIKGGDSWTELTDWASDKARSGLPRIPEHRGPSQQHIDYAAPSYFHAFAEFLTKENSSLYAWNIKQFQRAEASSDWLMGQMLKNEKMIPFAGWVSLSNDNTPTFSNFSDGEDFRLAWRTILNNVWYGNPSSTWDPVTHQIKSGTPNTFERDIGIRYSKFLWDSRQSPWNRPCMPCAKGDSLTLFWGPDILKYYYTPLGEPLVPFALNWVPGTGSPSAVIAQNFNLMAELYRSLEIKWDTESGGRYLTSVPHYFHGWFRVLGMLTLTGNYQSPSEIKPTANVKVYLDIDKTFAFESDTVNYTIDYRNYGSIDAQNVTIVDTLHKDFVYISSSGGGIYNAGSNTVTWNKGTLPGFKTATGVDPTTGQVKLTVKIGTANEKQYRNRATISCSNGSGWTSNEYPNTISSVMERNYIDIAKRALIIKKTASNIHVNPEKELQFTIDFENSSEAGWINGGRTGVQFAYSHDPLPSGSAEMTSMRMRLFHDADEAYIDYGNYRVSYFLFDAGLNCYKGDGDCTNGWEVKPTIVEGIDKNFVKILHENIIPGEGEDGKKWNQRIIVQFSDPLDPKRTLNLTTTNYHIDWYSGADAYIHRGGTATLRLVWNVNTSTWTKALWSDDWSWDPKAQDTDGGKYWPVTSDWTDPDNPDIPVTTWDPKECARASHTVNNVLVEEWDGYTWRRVAGNGPLPGREAINVIIKDTIPAGFTFSRFTGDAPLGIAAKVNGNIITWTIPKLQVKQSGSLKYIVNAAGSCPMQNKKIMTRAWISADKESPINDSVEITITCDSVPPPPPSATTMYKLSDKLVYQKDDTVTYKIAYKQTHGTIVTNGADINEWIDKGGKGKFNITGDTIKFDKQNAMMVHKYSYGVNGTFGGSIDPPYWATFSLVARSSGNDYVEIRIFKDYGDMLVKFFNNTTQVGGDQRFTYKNFGSTLATFNFKIRLSGDTISLWAGDTTGPSPNVTQTGIAIRAGNAGVKSGSDVAQAKVWNWNSHFDAAFDMTIHDKLPSDLSFKSAGGSIITGSLKGRELLATFDNGDITWPVVSGDETLGANDSLALWIKATLNDCTGDTILNTAFSNIRGYPVDYIGARAKITCSSGDDKKPDHIDIILDTVNFNRTKDEYLDPLTLGSNQKTFILYAVVRDKFGNFLSFASNATWSSTDLQTATVNSSTSGKWIGTISNIGPGFTTINVGESGIRGDSIAVTITASAAWPSIKSAIMRDMNGDLSPDMLSISLISDFENGQKFDSVTIEYRGKLYSIPAASVGKQSLILSVPFTSLTGRDSRPAGNVTIYMTVDGSAKQNTKSFVDGVGPSLSAASVMESDADTGDVLVLTFSEEVLPGMLSGNQLLLIKANSTDTVMLNIAEIIDFRNDSTYTVKITKVSKRPMPGDALRLVPGSKEGTISDRNFNVPHDLNRSVTLAISRGPAHINSAAYFDRNADGFVDYVKVRFKRSVDKSEIAKININWNIPPSLKSETVLLDSIEKINDSTYRFPASGKTVAPENLLTNPGMDISIVYLNFEGAPVNSRVADSAAPVAVSAHIFPGALMTSGVRSTDTLVVTLSEKVKESFGTEPFLLASKYGTGDYRLTLQFTGSQGASYRFLITSDNSGPANLFTKGDSLWINPSAQISDLGGAIQENSLNHRVLLDIVWPPSIWRVTAGPNPFSPFGRNESITIKVTPTTVVDMENVEVKCKIYDAVGNTVFANSLQLHKNSFDGDWDGCNRKGRIVGKGTYSAVIWITDNGRKTVEKLLIGVKK